MFGLVCPLGVEIEKLVRINFEAKLAKSVPPSVLPKIRRAPNEDQYLASELMRRMPRASIIMFCPSRITQYYLALIIVLYS